ncbi:MAG: hypothetical protein EX271_00265 [Acidimicrobiales bacterium]|nr:hypothetical protein [Hyphomonadaceae bacterium]RZV45016.1 MAG: hypothetical protein EX271_00265 [Acidimicrobiales bacterium]
MSDFDQKIKEALDAETVDMLADLEEQGLFAQLGGLFKGKLAWLGVVTIIFGTIAAFTGFYAAWQFIIADDIQSMLRWAALAWALLQANMMIKIWSWMRMETNRSLRETKRLELQVARLLARD